MGANSNLFEIVKIINIGQSAAKIPVIYRNKVQRPSHGVKPTGVGHNRQ